MIRVLIVEDHQVLAEGLELALSRREDIQVVGIAGSVARARDVAAECKPDIVLLDYHLPDGKGTDAAAAIRQSAPGVALVMLTGEEGEEALAAAVEAGACGYLLKTRSVTEVAEAVRRAAEGEILLPAAALVRLIVHRARQSALEAERSRLLRLLTAREREVLALMAKGLDNRGIAERLVISFSTTRTHVQNIIEKLGTHSKLAAVARASEYGLLD